MLLDSALALVHSRFSTNTSRVRMPLAQSVPLFIAHNGEIGCAATSTDARARSAVRLAAVRRRPEEDSTTWPRNAWTHYLDNVLELSAHIGRELPHAVLI